ncbi:hypothetical protein GCM10009751_16070 [Myceligenerans crystallogenes]|uniref:Uncharacterized protein n=1 Tax=Myceligenerans crystallogenes TaxID=316335 RepID=A0ABN2NB22_9MICO
MRFVRSGALGDREDLLAQQPVDVRFHDAVGGGVHPGFARGTPGALHEEGPYGIDLEQWHNGVPPVGSARSPGDHGPQEFTADPMVT